MDKLSPSEAADAIRFGFETEGMEPEDQHRVKFAEQVCGELNIAKTPQNIQRVMNSLEKHGIDGSSYEAFPGWFENDLGERAVCSTEEDRDAFMARSKDENGVVAPDQGTIDAHGKFHLRHGTARKRDIRATMPRYADEKDIQEVGESANDGAPLHRVRPLGEGKPTAQRTDHMPDPNSLLLNPPNPVDPTHDNRPRPGDNPATNPRSEVEIPRPAGNEKTDAKREGDKNDNLNRDRDLVS
jgi:hypothetical protein